MDPYLPAQRILVAGDWRLKHPQPRPDHLWNVIGHSNEPKVEPTLPSSLIPRIVRALEGFSNRKLFLAISVPLFAIYLATAGINPNQHIDPYTNTLTAWKLGTAGTVYLDDLDHATGPQFLNQSNQLIRSADGRPVSKYPPGTALLAAPLYAIWRDAPIEVFTFQDLDGSTIDVAQPQPSRFPAQLVASLTTAVAVGVMTVLFRKLTTGSLAYLAGITLGLGTSLWSVASDALWQHGPASMWIALGLWWFANNRTILGGFAFGAAIITRPQIVAMVAVVGLYLAWKERSWRRLLHAGIPAALGLGSYVTFNLATFSHALPEAVGGYFVEGNGGTGFLDIAQQTLSTLVDPTRGILLWSPFLLVCIPGLVKGWRTAPPWAQGASLAGIAYLFFQLRGNQFAGGEGFFAYRYPIEMLVATCPLLTVSAVTWAHNKVRRTATGVAVAVSIAIQLLGAFTY